MKLLSTLLLAITLALFSCQSDQKESTENAVTQTSTDKNTPNRVELIDFYGTHRCVTCKAIEANAKYTVEEFFSANEKVVFKTVNVDEEANYDMAEAFEATGTALFLNVVKDGKETHIDLTEFAFEDGRDKEAFAAELKSKIEKELKKI